MTHNSFGTESVNSFMDFALQLLPMMTNFYSPTSYNQHSTQIAVGRTNILLKFHVAHNGSFHFLAFFVATEFHAYFTKLGQYTIDIEHNAFVRLCIRYTYKNFLYLYTVHKFSSAKLISEMSSLQVTLL